MTIQEMALRARRSFVSGAFAFGAEPAPRPLQLDALSRVRLDSDSRFSHTTCVLLLVPTLWFAISDSTLARGHVEWFASRVAVRVGLIATLLLGAVFIPMSATRERYEFRVQAVTVLSALGILALNVLRPSDIGVPLRTPLLWLFALYVGFPNRPARQLIAPFVLTIGLASMPVFWNASVQPDSVSGNVLVLLTVNAVGVLLVLRRHELATREAEWEADAERAVLAERAMSELRTLKGIIPICSFCKKVHTEIGDWQQVEAYVRARSAAEFSHGVCPSCMAVHYPDFGGDDPQART